jgi:hypothetical protein
MWLVLSEQPATFVPPAGADVWAARLGGLLCLIAIWLDVEPGVSYWDFADKGRALPLLMLVLVLGGAALRTAAMQPEAVRTTIDGALIVAALAFGLYEAIIVISAFGDLGRLDAGAWLGGVGAAIVLISVVDAWRRAVTLAA